MLSRHWLMSIGVTVVLVLLSASVLIRWRIASLIVRILLRPSQPAARLIEIFDNEARRLSWFLSGTILAVLILVGFFLLFSRGARSRWPGKTGDEALQ